MPAMSKPSTSFDALLDVFAEYLTLEDDNCLSLPPSAYGSSELHQRELERIFHHEWLCVGREEYLPEPGDYYCFTLLDDPLIIVRGEDREIRALANVCRHRYMPLVSGQSKTERFVCPYHAWGYDTSGQLVAAPHMEGSKRFDMAGCRLPRYRLESWNGFLFVNLDDEAAPLAPRMLTLDTHIENYRVGEQVEIMHYETEWAGNWKLAAENSMEYYHHVGLHRDTLQAQTPARKTYLPPPPHDLSFCHQRCGMNIDAIDTSAHPMQTLGRTDTFTEEELITGYMVYVFPAFTMAMRPNSNNWLSFRPIDAGRTGVLGGYLVSEDVRDQYPDIATQKRELILRVNEEDSLATTELAKTVRSTRAARGPLSPFEGTLAQFYRYLARRVLDAPVELARVENA